MKYHIPEFDEVWIKTGTGNFAKGEEFYEFDVEGEETKISHYAVDSFEKALKDGSIIEIK